MERIDEDPIAKRISDLREVLDQKKRDVLAREGMIVMPGIVRIIGLLEKLDGAEAESDEEEAARILSRVEADMEKMAAADFFITLIRAESIVRPDRVLKEMVQPRVKSLVGQDNLLGFTMRRI